MVGVFLTVDRCRYFIGEFSSCIFLIIARRKVSCILFAVSTRPTFGPGGRLGKPTKNDRFDNGRLFWWNNKQFSDHGFSCVYRLWRAD